MIQCNTKNDDMSVSIRVNYKELQLIKKYAKLNETTVSEVMRNAILEKIEDEFDIFLYEKTYEGSKSNPKIYTLEESSKILGF